LWIYLGITGNIWDVKMLYFPLGFWKFYRAFKSGGMLLFDDFVALCHAVPLTRNNRFAYNLRSNIKKRDKAKPVVGQGRKYDSQGVGS
jgi:hypothetical protein